MAKLHARTNSESGADFLTESVRGEAGFEVYCMLLPGHAGTEEESNYTARACSFSALTALSHAPDQSDDAPGGVLSTAPQHVGLTPLGSYAKL